MNAERILCPVDFSSASDVALETAASLARELQATLYIVHVERSPYTFSPSISGNFPNPADPDSHLLWRKVPQGDDVRFEHALLLGDPETEIVRFAEENHVDVIVLGTEGRTGISRLVMGSVAEAVLRNAPMPVLTVKPHGGASQLVTSEDSEHEPGD